MDGDGEGGGRGAGWRGRTFPFILHRSLLSGDISRRHFCNEMEGEKCLKGEDF